MLTVYALSFHAEWRCGRSGACCTSGWPIPVEPAPAARLRRALQAGELDLSTAVAGSACAAPLLFAPGLGPEHVALAGMDPRGRCLFFEPAAAAPASCALQRQLGPGVVPLACRLFPRVCRLEPRGVTVTLSHYCPTAAAALLDDERPFTLVRDPPAFPGGAPYEGLDAREALPPLLRPDALFDWDSHARWEQHVLATLGRAELSPEAALDRLAVQAERLRAWRAADGPLGGWMDVTLAAAVDPEPGTWRRLHGLAPGRPGDLELFRRVCACLPAGVEALARGATAVPAPAGDDDERYVAPAWERFAGPVKRYLAAKAAGGWCAHQGRGLRAAVLDLGASLALLRVQAARLAGRAGRVLDPALFLEALRAADLLLLHLAAREQMSAAWSAGEERA